MINPLISIIVPTFNRQDTIERCLESILLQTYRNYEVIIVDDGSSDRSLEAILAYLQLNNILPLIKDLRSINYVQIEQIKPGNSLHDFPSAFRCSEASPNWFILTQNNSGPAIARNTGIHASHGDYISFLDSDDIWYNYTLANLARVIAENPEISFIAGSAIEHSLPPNQTCSNSSHVSNLQYTLYQNYYSSSSDSLWIGTPSVCIRRCDLLTAGLFDSHRYNAEDSHLWMKLGITGKFAYIHNPATFAYCRSYNSAVSDDISTFRGLMFILSYESMNKYPGCSKYQACRSRIIAMHIKPFCLALVKHHYSGLAARLYSGSLRHLVLSKDYLFIVCYPFIYFWHTIAFLSCELFSGFCFAFGISNIFKPRVNQLKSFL
jgi:glycosyltransferase involved in cell wall biosynthesis